MAASGSSTAALKNMTQNNNYIVKVKGSSPKMKSLVLIKHHSEKIRDRDIPRRFITKKHLSQSVNSKSSSIAKRRWNKLTTVLRTISIL